MPRPVSARATTAAATTVTRNARRGRGEDERMVHSRAGRWVSSQVHNLAQATFGQAWAEVRASRAVSANATVAATVASNCVHCSALRAGPTMIGS